MLQDDGKWLHVKETTEIGEGKMCVTPTYPPWSLCQQLHRLRTSLAEISADQCLLSPAAGSRPATCAPPSTTLSAPLFHCVPRRDAVTCHLPNPNVVQRCCLHVASHSELECVQAKLALRRLYIGCRLLRLLGMMTSVGTNPQLWVPEL